MSEWFRKNAGVVVFNKHKKGKVELFFFCEFVSTNLIEYMFKNSNIKQLDNTIAIGFALFNPASNAA